MNLFISLLCTMILAYVVALFSLLATGSIGLAFVIAGATGLYFGFMDAHHRRQRGKGK